MFWNFTHCFKLYQYKFRFRFQETMYAYKTQSQEDLDRISRVTSGAPIMETGCTNSLGRRTIASLQQIERNRQLHLAQQGLPLLSIMFARRRRHSISLSRVRPTIYGGLVVLIVFVQVVTSSKRNGNVWWHWNDEFRTRWSPSGRRRESREKIIAIRSPVSVAIIRALCLPIEWPKGRHPCNWMRANEKGVSLKTKFWEKHV